MPQLKKNFSQESGLQGQILWYSKTKCVKNYLFWTEIVLPDLLCSEEVDSYSKSEVCYTINMMMNLTIMIQNYWKVNDQCHFTRIYQGTETSIFNLRYAVLCETLNYCREWVKLWIPFEDKSPCRKVLIQAILMVWRENISKHIVFSISLDKKLRK